MLSAFLVMVAQGGALLKRTNNMGIIHKISDWYFSRKSIPHWSIFAFDCFIVYVVSIVVHFMFKGIHPTLAVFPQLCLTLLIYLIFYVLGFRIFRTYSGILRYSSFVDLLRVAGAVLIGGALGFALHYFMYANNNNLFVPIRGREVIATAVFSTLVMWLVRIIVKFVYETTFDSTKSQRVFIYGIKAGGIGLAKSIRAEKPVRFTLKGFISGQEDESGAYLMGVRVYKIGKETVRVMKNKGISALLVSPMKNDEFIKNRELQDDLIDAGIKMYIIPKAREWKEGSEQFQTLREVQVEDLLARDEIKVDMEAVANLLREKKILITGSAGSIGSEIVRQIATYHPASMVLIDQAETPQHDIRLMMHNEYSFIKAETIVTSITDAARMEEIFSQYRPDYVFHAAAYKHVPMMEDNPSEAVKNNVYGTRVIADLSVKYGVKKFVMISTDKAVNPTNVMGCSKRICEIYVQSLNNALRNGSVKAEGQEAATQFVTTRFGNVLGSNGSVIPLFKKQIREGGPLTVTHPDIIRYFMLIPEACKLVLEAGTMGKGGEIFVFDMGAPVKIADLAKRMIRLSGAVGVEIKFTGLRDGEKLYEEVLNEQETTLPTFHEKIRIAQVREYDYKRVCQELDELSRLAMQFDDMATVRQMKKIVPEYKSRNSKYEALDKETKD